MIPFITTILPILGSVLEKVIPNNAEREKVKMEIQLKLAEQEGELVKALLQSDIAQTEINKAEAASANIFVAGWRPLIGWICGTAFAWAYVISPMLAFILRAAGHPVDLPSANLGEMMPVLLGMLGLGGLRSLEKKQGVAAK